MRRILCLVPLLGACGLDLKALAGLDTFDTSASEGSGGSSASGPATGPEPTTLASGEGTSASTVTSPDDTGTATVGVSATTEATSTSFGDTGTTTIGGSETAADTTTGEPVDCSVKGPLIAGAPANTRSHIVDLAVFPNGDFAIAGAYAGDLGLGDLAATPPQQASSAFVARVRCDGELQWIRRLSDRCLPGEVIPDAIAVTRDGAGVAVTGNAVDNDTGFVAWVDGDGEPVDGMSGVDCHDQAFAHDLAQLDANAVVAGIGNKLIRYAAGEAPMSVATHFGQPAALLAREDGSIYAAEIANDPMLNVVVVKVMRYTSALAWWSDIGLAMGPLVAPELGSEIEHTSTTLAYDESIGLLAVGGIAADFVGVLVEPDPMPKAALKDCVDGSLFVVVDVSGEPTKFVAARCLSEDLYRLRALQFTANQALLLAGFTSSVPPTPAYAVAGANTYDPAPIVLAGLSMKSPGYAHGQVSRILPLEGAWIVAGGYPAEAMTLAGSKFMGGSDPQASLRENLFLGRVSPP